MNEKLGTYRKKRRPGRTPEPIPEDADEVQPPREGGPKRSARSRRAGDATEGPRFVIQEHHARRLHWDFRLERDGVLVSWALPRGLPLDPKRNHLAVHTEDHPLEYGSFEGEIPAGEYGAGKVVLWDHGTYACEKWTDREVIVVLHGSRASGRYVLFATARSGDKDWMIHRMDPAPSGWAALPGQFRPMLCQPGDAPPPDAKGWAYEFKWDGVRAGVFVQGGTVRVVSRNQRDVTASYPELRALGDALGSRELLLDGEIVAFDDEGRPSFGVLQQRMHVTEGARARRLASRVPVTYLVFDLLHLDGRSTTELAWDERRKLLESLGLQGPAWATPPAFVDVPAPDMVRAARGRGLEGIVAKWRASRYQPGRRSADWVKIKNVRFQEVVIGGWTPGTGSRAATFGALVLGIPGPDGLRYVGKVGSGFSEQALEDLSGRFRRLARRTAPFAGALPKAEVAGATWVRPTLVGEVQFSEWTAEHRLRQSSWRGLRTDKNPAEITFEDTPRP